jgi:hypothetical protein
MDPPIPLARPDQWRRLDHEVDAQHITRRWPEDMYGKNDNHPDVGFL